MINLLKSKIIIKNKNLISYFIIAILGVLVCIPLFKMNLNDYNEFRIHIGRIVSVKEILKDGVFPPFISSKHMLTFGYALNIFYGVFTTYIPILISLVTKTSTIALKIYTVLSVVLSGITMYRFSLKVSKKKLVALISALVYMVAPYKLCDIYSRNAVGEYVAFIFIPMIFEGIYQLINEDKKGNYLLIVGATLLVLTHTITTVYTALFATIYLLFNITKLKSKKIWKWLCIDVLVIILSTLFYTYPLVEHKIYGNYSIYDEEMMNSSGQHVYLQENTNTPMDWFSHEIKTGLNYSFGIVIIILMLLTIPCMIKKYENDRNYKNNKREKNVDEVYKNIYSTYTTFWVISLIALYMTTRAFPWVVMPQVLTIIQFAWRINGFFLFFISFICGINAYIFANEIIKNKWLKNVFIVFIIGLTYLMSSLTAFKNVEDYNPVKELQFEKNIIEATSIGPYNINRDYLPKAAGKNIKYMQNRKNETIVLNGQAKIIKENKVKLKDEVEIEVENGKEVILELPYIYYHGYETKINGKKIKNQESDKGFLQVELNESGTLQVEYKGTIGEKIAMIVSFISFMGFLGYLGYLRYIEFKNHKLLIINNKSIKEKRK